MPKFRDRPTPTVSIIVVNFNGKSYLGPCLTSLRGLQYAADKVEVILIDNASTDGSVQYVREVFPEVRIEVNDTNTGFSPAVNQGARLAGGDYLALINNDAEADPEWLVEAVKVLELRSEVGAVASKILRDDRETIDYSGGEMSFYGHGFARRLQQVDDERPVTERTLFASGGAMITRRELFLDVGGFDDSYFAFFEDVDYGWRLWVLGHEVHLVPASKVFHRHHGTIERFGYARERYLLERNALATLFKNYGEENLASVLPPTLLLVLMRAFVDKEDNLPDFRIKTGSEPLDDEPVTITAHTASHLAALRDFGLDLERLRKKRQEVQRRRKTADSAILKLFRQTFRSNVNGVQYLDVFAKVLKAFDLEAKLGWTPKVLILTQDTLSARMAGPAIRAWEMATVLSHDCEVDLGSTGNVDDAHMNALNPPFGVYHLAPTSGIFKALYNAADVVIFQGFVNLSYPELITGDKPLIVDLYDPFHLEGLSLRKHDPELERYATARTDVGVLNQQLTRGDFFVCASEKQRDFWLGQLSALLRINPATFDHDESLRALIDVAPFGFPGGPPIKAEGKVLRGVVDGIDDDDFVLVWGGGIYNWFDPLTLIRGVGKVVDEHPEVKLWFMGSAHPNPGVPKMQMAHNAYRLAEELGLLGKHVFFNEGWVPYHQRQNFLLEADVGVSTHYEHLETAFSFRTRVLDYLWCSLPIIATDGDSLSVVVKERELGLTVPPEDVDAVAAAIVRLREDRAFYERCVAGIEALQPEMTWERVLEPIVQFCSNPQRAADAEGKPQRYISTDYIVLSKSPLHYAKRVVHYARVGGPQLAMVHARNFLRARLGR